MLRIKRLYTFIYQTFIPIFAMTFGICLFIFIIQFLWQHIEKLVGKGLETSVLLELFFFAALNLIPMVLPLAILLASLMTFGNMGERLELLAIKASGVSLLRIMQPMIILVVAITVGCFFFQNKMAPKFRVKVASLFYAIKQKSPELDIPEGAFYNDLTGYSIYVKKKNLDTHMLHGVIIYDTTSGGFKNMSVDVCDSAIMRVADSKDYLTITMFDGQRFSNMKQDNNRATNSSDFVPYVREHFKTKEVIIPFSNNFERIDEARYDDTQISKNLAQLQSSIDSMSIRLDSLNVIDRKSVASQPYTNFRTQQAYKDSLAKVDEGHHASVLNTEALNFDSIMASLSLSTKNEVLNMASSDARSRASNHLMYFHVDVPKPMLQRNIRMHEIYWHRMFSLPFACLVFFFIGAPLGSIIRKGGLGVPVIISVVLFIIYYVIDNIGYKMARDGVWPVWQGIWLSTAVLFPLGVFLTYKSMKESALFNVEIYGKYLREFLKIKSDPSRSETKEPNPADILPISALNADPEQVAAFREFDNKTLKDIIHNYKEYGYKRDVLQIALGILKERETYFFDVRVKNYDYNYSKKLLSFFTENSMKFAIPLYVLTILLFVLDKILGGSAMLLSLAILSGVVYLAFFLKSTIYMLDFRKSVGRKDDIAMHSIVLSTNPFMMLFNFLLFEGAFYKYVLLFLFYPVQYSFSLKTLNADLKRIETQRF